MVREASQRRAGRIQFLMNQARQSESYRNILRVVTFLGVFVLAGIQAEPLRAQDAAQGPLTPPPEHHLSLIHI